MSEHLERLARRVKDDPFFLAAALSAYQRGTAVDDPALATKLGCSPETLIQLRLSRMPAIGAPEFWRDIQIIAERFSVDPDALAEVVRLGHSIVRLQTTAATTADDAGLLMAARDDDRDSPSTSSPGDER